MRLRTALGSSGPSRASWKVSCSARPSQVAESSRQGAARTYTDTRRNKTPVRNARSQPEALLSPRHFHRSSRTLHRPESLSHHRLQALQVTLPDAAYDEGIYDGGSDIAQILAEWRARRRSKIATPSLKGKERMRDDSLDAPTEARHENTATQLPDDFFSRQGFLERGPSATEVADGEAITAQHHRARRRDPPKSLLAGLDPALCAQVMTSCRAAITAGSCDLHRLARDALSTLQTSENIVEHLAILRELELSIFNSWVCSARDGINQLASSTALGSHFIILTQELYASLAEQTQGVAASSISLHLHRAVLHRLFTVTHSISQSPSAAPKLQRAALALCAQVLRDKAFKASHARYLLRKLTTRLRMEINSNDRITNSLTLEQVWPELQETYVACLESAVMPASAAQSVAAASRKSAVYSLADDYFCFASAAMSRKAVETSTISRGMLEMARLLQHKFSSACVAREDATAPFVSSAAVLAQIVDKLSFSKAADAAYELAYMAPPTQRRLPVLASLMRHWSSVPLRLPIGSSPLQLPEGAVSTDMARSRQLLSDAASALVMDCNDSQASLFRVCEARMAYHAKHGCSRSVRADLVTLQEALSRTEEHPKVSNLVDALARLNIRAQLDAVRALVIGGEWQKAVVLAKKLSSKTEVAISTRFLNTLLSASVSRAEQKSSSDSSAVNRGRRRNTPPQMVKISRLLTFVERYCHATGCMPNAQTRVILLAGVSRLKSNVCASFDSMTRDIQWSWEERGVSAVVAEVRLALRQGRLASRQTRLQAGARAATIKSDDAGHAVAASLPIFRPVALSLLRRRPSHYRPVKVGASRLR